MVYDRTEVRDRQLATPETIGREEPSHFGGFEVRRQQRQLFVGGKPVEVGSRAFEVLLILIDARGKLVTKSELMERVWPDLQSRKTTCKCRSTH